MCPLLYPFKYHLLLVEDVNQFVASEMRNYESALRCFSRIGPSMVVSSYGGSGLRLFLILRPVDPMVTMKKGDGIKLGNRSRGTREVMRDKEYLVNRNYNNYEEWPMILARLGGLDDFSTKDILST
ncbi:hypothetical protein HZH68_012631 [Vespula germanica]|uniref:Uncharacterized protein n=1 Tax=Vespula germanica TaxID=30212 RepID=A0A834JI19_VESGE|nr:hypothetical protein HZH68_012631 [Vespula germanica]